MLVLSIDISTSTSRSSALHMKEYLELMYQKLIICFLDTVCCVIMCCQILLSIKRREYVGFLLVGEKTNIENQECLERLFKEEKFKNV